MTRCIQCPVEGGDTWPKCVGPVGCMRSPDKQPRSDAEPIAQPWAEPEIIENLSQPKTEMYGPIRLRSRPRLKGDSHRRKSVSVSISIYNKLKEASISHEISMSGIIEQECRIFFGDEENEVKFFED